ncbi:MAG: hypothetical protein KAZ26_20035 [Caldilineaceae bacterium]|nr:hypothetical protein [Caldilineaceae bacterium]
MTHQRITIQSAILLILVALLLAFCNGSVSAQAPILTPDQRTAAETAAGEVSALLFGVDAYVDTLCTVRNRKASDSFPDSLGGVLAGFYALPRVLSQVEETAAVEAFQPAGCDGRPWLFAMSAGDVERLGFGEGERVYTYTLPSGRILEAHFYDTSPWEAAIRIMPAE